MKYSKHLISFLAITFLNLKFINAQTQSETFKDRQYLKIENHWKQYDEIENKYFDVIESEITIKFNSTADSISIVNFENQYNLIKFRNSNFGYIDYIYSQTPANIIQFANSIKNLSFIEF